MGKKFFTKKNIRVLCAVALLCIILYEAISNLILVKTSTKDLNNISLGLDAPFYDSCYDIDELSSNGHVETFKLTDSNYNPDDLNLTPKKIIEKAFSYYYVNNYKLAGKGYNNWSRIWKFNGDDKSQYTDLNYDDFSYEDIEKSIRSKTADVDKIESIVNLDSSGLIYATLRSLGVELTNFVDTENPTFDYTNIDQGRVKVKEWARLGLVPANIYSWVHIEKQSDGKNINVTPYPIKWINGADIVNISDYVVAKTWDKDQERWKTEKTYDQFISENNIEPGSVIVAANPAATYGVNNAYHHAWFYIGNIDRQFNNEEEIRTYLNKYMGIEYVASECIQIYYETPTETTGHAWSLEATSNLNGMSGVILSNRDPAENMNLGEGLEGKRRKWLCSIYTSNTSN